MFVLWPTNSMAIIPHRNSKNYKCQHCQVLETFSLVWTHNQLHPTSGKIRLASSVPNVPAPPLGTAGKVASVLTFSLQAPHSFSPPPAAWPSPPPPSFPLGLLHRPLPMLAFSSRSDSSRREVEATEAEEPPCWQLLYLIWKQHNLCLAIGITPRKPMTHCI